MNKSKLPGGGVISNPICTGQSLLFFSFAVNAYSIMGVKVSTLNCPSDALVTNVNSFSS